MYSLNTCYRFSSWALLVKFIYCSQVNATEHLQRKINIGSGKGLVASGNKPFEIHIFWFMKMHLKMLSAKWQPFCLGGDELMVYIMTSACVIIDISIAFRQNYFFKQYVWYHIIQQKSEDIIFSPWKIYFIHCFIIHGHDIFWRIYLIYIYSSIYGLRMQSSGEFYQINLQESISEHHTRIYTHFPGFYSNSPGTFPLPIRTCINGWHITGNIFTCIFLKESHCTLTQISLKIVPRNPIDEKSAWVKLMAWH